MMAIHRFCSLALALVVVLWATVAAAAQALKGMALVIGQSKYESIPALANAGNDAKAMGQLLEELGFTVTFASDRNGRRLARDLENFVADAGADKADVAVIYYSGHGIEAGGENFLVATDSRSQEGFLPVSGFLADLKASVPVTIILLDACRTNPFPPGFSLSLKSGTAAASAAGLGVPRGFGEAADNSLQGIGMVIGFSAAPGTAALDGEPGGNSPYAAALLRHLAALKGLEFGQVMRMVTEEVYLKTQGRQRPWLNESLTKFLYFGGEPVAPDSVQSAIDGERRPLLLMIADLPEARRTRVEEIAIVQGVALDTLYGVLRALGESDLPQDDESLARLLAEKASQLAQFREERTALASDDPDVRKLAAAADLAIAEGAMAAARDFLDDAKTRIAATRGTIDRLGAEVRDKRIANAAVFAKSGKAAFLSFDYKGAAADFGEAFEWVKDADRDLAWRYLWSQALWMMAHGEESGDTEAIAGAIPLFEQAFDYVSRDASPVNWAQTQNDLAVALRKLGEIRGDAGLLQRAVAANGLALTVRDRSKMPEKWADTQMNLGNVLGTLGLISGDKAQFYNAVAAYQEALKVYTADTSPADWSNAQTNLGIALGQIGNQAEGTVFLERAVAAFEAVLAVRNREEMPLAWASAQGNLGSALASLGDRRGDRATLMNAVAAYEAALNVLPRSQAPARWARMQNNLGDAWRLIGKRESGTASLVKALDALEKSRQLRSRDSVPLQWALVTANIGNVRSMMAERTGDRDMIMVAIADQDAALEVFSPRRQPRQWYLISRELVHSLRLAGQLKGSRALLERGLSVARGLEDYNAETQSSDTAVAAAIAEMEAAIRALPD